MDTIKKINKEISILKERKGEPTVILIDGRRYIWDPSNKVTKKQKEA